MALYPAAVKRLIPLDKGKDPAIKPRVAILHVDAGNASTLAPYFTSGSKGIESHFYIKKDGTVEQYRDTAYQADANMDANDFAVSIETQGFAAGQWTDAQLSSIKALLLWLNKTHGIPLVKCQRWDGSGVGYHILFMQAWAGGPRSCPGPDRIKQFDNVLVPWMAASGDEDDMPLTDEDLDKIALRVWGYANKDVTYRDAYAHLTGTATEVWKVLVGNPAKPAGKVLGGAAGVQVTAADIASAIPDDIAQQVVDALASRLNVSPKES